MRPKTIHTVGAKFVVAEVKLLEEHEVCQVQRQRFGTIIDIVLAEAKLLDGGEMRQVGANQLGTFVT